MLFAQMQQQNDMNETAILLGHLFAILLCGAIPIITGLSCKKPVLGLVGGLVSAGFAISFACLSGLPIALIFLVVIIIVANQEKEQNYGRRRQRDYDDYDDRPHRRYDEIEDEEEERERRGPDPDERRGWNNRLDDIDEDHRRLRRRDFDD